MEYHFGPSSGEGMFLLPEGWEGLDESYHPLPLLYLGFLLVWSISTLSWSLNTWRNGRFQMKKLQWILVSIPFIKALQMGSYYFFWSSCIKLQVCSLWMSFGAYITGIIFQTLSYVCFMLISYGYCIMCEQLSVCERRRIALLALGLYLALVGYKTALPFFSVVLALVYLASYGLIFYHISSNLLTLTEQLSYVEGENIHVMRETIQSKWTMFRKFQKAMQMVAIIEITIHIDINASKDDYWIRLMIREWVQFLIYIYIGWAFRSQAVPSHFYIVPNVKDIEEKTIPPIYSIEIDCMDFNDLACETWQLGVHSPHASSCNQCHADSLLVIVQNPHQRRKASR